MNDSNPYESPSEHGQYIASEQTPRTTVRWIMTGFVLAAAIPVVFGVFGLYRESVYAASLPAGTGACGMGSLAALIIVIVGGPICGMIGGVVAWVASKIRPWKT